MDVVLFHNPACPISCKVREMLQDEGLEPVILDYLKTPPKADELRVVLKLLKANARRANGGHALTIPAARAITAKHTLK